MMRLAWLWVVAGLAFSGCDAAGTDVPVAAGADAQAAVPVAATPAAVLRGEYLVRSIAGCGECHTPRDAQGDLDMSHWLAGVTNRFDLVPEDDTTGGISAPNLTPASLADWSDADIEHAFLDGVAKDGSPLYPLMPYYAYRNMTSADADAIVAYLRAVPAVDNDVAPRQPLPVSLVAPAPPIPDSAIPQTTLAATDADYASAQRGRYLAGEVGFCLDCHTPWRYGVATPLDMSRAFAGNRAFSAREWSMPAPSPVVVYSYNVTPDPSGIKGWSAGDVVKLLSAGTTPDGSTLCGPMPFGPIRALGAIVPSDARDIGVYLDDARPGDRGSGAAVHGAVSRVRWFSLEGPSTESQLS